MSLPLLLALPWLLVGPLLLVRIRWPRELPPAGELREPSEAPLVSVVIPARNEAANIEACLGSVTASIYPAFEVLVVDDRSEDRTAELAAAVPPGRARRLEVIRGEELPSGWFGKPWACWQGARAARGNLLLFTDADTRHDPELLERAVAAMHEDGAEIVTVMARQLMETFWEKVIQPHVFFLLVLRYHDLREPLGPERWRDALANGQFILVDREMYERIGGHEAVKGEVVEDMRLAQEACRAGARLSLREGEDVLATRMYRSLGGLLEGWTKNLATGLRQAGGGLPGWLLVAATAALTLGFWVVPPVWLALGLARGGDPTTGALLWAALATGAGLLLWAGAMWRARLSPLWGLSYPLGALLLAFIVLRSGLRGDRIEWKGRVYGESSSATPKRSSR